jgi:hypothetical protein
MIDWKKSAELNKCTIAVLKARFLRFPNSHKKVVTICDKCGESRIINFCGVTDLCYACAVRSPERSEKLSESCMGRVPWMKGKHHTDAAKKKLSDAGKGKQKRLGAVLSDETKQKIGNANRGKKHSAESSRKKSKATRGIPRGPHTLDRCQRMSAGLQGIPYDEWESFAREKKYCPKFSEACRESNREKYSRRCFICGKSEKANGRKLSVHHVDMNKAQGCESNWKLVPLCMACHATAHNDEMIARLGYMVKDR